jgi:O-antigen ligase
MGAMQERTEQAQPRKAAAIAALALVGPALGTATELWAQAAMVLALGVLLIAAPPRRSPGATWLALFALIAGFGLATFLPARWIGVPEWRRIFEAEYSVTLPPTVSPQPWLSAHSGCLLFAGLSFALYLIAHQWQKEDRHRAIRIYAAGIATLVALAILAMVLKWRPPFWPEVRNSNIGFGFFPNRNQTANVIALAGILSTALAFGAFRRRRKIAWVWTGAVLLLGVGAVLAFSRAGILLFFGGIASWVIFSTAHSTSRKGAALAVAGVALALTAFFLFGGETFERFQRGKEQAAADYRLAIQPDALRLSIRTPWFGQGLGNFQPVFAMARAASADENRALHPESDWLWVAVEMGWPAALLVAAAFFLWMKQSTPFSRGSDRSLRSAAAVCGVGFALHALVDVAGHRPGSAWPAIFLAGLALHSGRQIDERRWVAPAFRLAGLTLVSIGVWWLASLRSDEVGKHAPTPGTISRLTAKMEQEIARGSRRSVFITAGEILHIQPLDAETYYKRAVLSLDRKGPSRTDVTWGPLRDFQRARFLEPNWVELCRLEGAAWLAANQLDLALDAWAEALNRSRGKAPALFDELMYESKSQPSMRAALGEIALTNPEFLLRFLPHCDRLETELSIGRLLDSDPELKSFPAPQRKRLFSLWFDRGDRPTLIAKLTENPAWLEVGWPWQAKQKALDKDFEGAYSTARKFSPPPTVPRIVSDRTPEELERAFHSRPDDFQVGLELFAAQRVAGKIEDALATLNALQNLPKHPPYLAFIESELHADRSDWEKAWNAWRRSAGPEFQ